MIVTGHGRRVAMAVAWARVARIAALQFRDPIRAARAVKSLADHRAAVRRGEETRKVVKVGYRYFSHLYAPGWPSPAFDRYVAAELDRAAGASNGTRPAPERDLRSVIFAITKSCPLRCEHCCEWDELNHRDTMSSDDIATIVERFRALGVTQFLFSGGEPLTRLDDIVSVVRGTAPGVDFWLLTAGVGLTPKRARRLSDAGVTGILISLDHWRPDRHDEFRGKRGSFEWVEKAAHAVRGADLVLGVTLCPTREFVTEENLGRYAQVASRLGAGFIQILEPRAVGHFAGKDVDLGPRERALLDRFCVRMNVDRALSDMPIVVYPGFAQRRLGCQGAGARYLYVDTDARLLACPFCRDPAGSALDPSLPHRIRELRERGCAFESEVCRTAAICD